MGCYGITEDLQDEINEWKRENAQLKKEIAELKNKVNFLNNEIRNLLDLLDIRNSG